MKNVNNIEKVIKEMRNSKQIRVAIMFDGWSNINKLDQHLD